jgi:hypothetical protein
VNDQLRPCLRAGELWRLYFVDLGELAIYCPDCAKREFGDAKKPTAI